MDGDVIKSFLVGLGFGVDDAGLAKFNKAIAQASLKVAALYGTVKVATAAVAFGISKISQSFEQLGYEYKIIAPAINKAIMLRYEMLRAYRAAGVNLSQVVQNAVKLNISITKTKYAFDAIYKSVAAKFFPLLTQQSDRFRKLIYDNMPKIQRALEKFVNFLFKAFEAASTLGARFWSVLTRVYDLFVSLDRVTGGWSTALLGAIAAWKILNLGFLATPLGMLLTGFGALLALWDDFKTFQEGGQALINWGSDTIKMFVGMGTAIGAIVGAIGAVLIAYKAWTLAQGVLNAVMLLNPIGLIIAGVVALTALIGILDKKFSIFGGRISGFFTSVGGRVLEFIGGKNIAENLEAQNSSGAVSPALLGTGSNYLESRQNVNQQTNINIAGVADAKQAGDRVLSEQSKVNFDLFRNLKGATVP